MCKVDICDSNINIDGDVLYSNVISKPSKESVKAEYCGFGWGWQGTNIECGIKTDGIQNSCLLLHYLKYYDSADCIIKYINEW